MEDLTGVLATLTLLGFTGVSLLYRAWRSRQGSSSADWSSDGDGGGDGGD
jgi:hypothetical protein